MTFWLVDSILALTVKQRSNNEQTHTRSKSTITGLGSHALLYRDFRHNPVLGPSGLDPVLYPRKDALILVDILDKACYNKHMMKTNEIVQWVGTAFVLLMYLVMNVFPQHLVLIQLFGLLGAVSFFAWTVRVRNYPQMVINVVAMTLCVVGLLTHFG